MIPSFLLTIWLSGLLAIAVFGGAAYWGHEWFQRSWNWDQVAGASVFAPALGLNATTALLALALALGLVAVAGRPLVLAWLRFASPSGRDSEPDPRVPSLPVSEHKLQRPDGSRLHVECYGPPDGMPLICTHGWGLSSLEWNYMKRSLPAGHRLIVWDLPGLGKSRGPANRDFSMVKMAGDLSAVVAFAGRPAVLLGHSIGGMITLTYLGMFPHAGGGPVRGIVLAHTTPTNPLRTTSGAAVLTAIEKPVLVPLMYLTIALSPLVRFMTCLAYANGSIHLLNKSSSFGGGQETWQQVDFSARFQPKASPAVLARGMLAMMHYDATAVLPGIASPALIVAGDRDTTTKPSASHSMDAAIRASQLIQLVPAKHLGLIEHHSAFNAAVANFCQSQSVTPTFPPSDGLDVPVRILQGDGA